MVFEAENELQQYLSSINPIYAKYTEGLWANEVNSISQLEDASLTVLQACGVENQVHAGNIIARSKATEAAHSDNSDVHENHRQKVETTLTGWLLQLEEQKAVLQESYIADGSPLLQARTQGLEALTKEIDQVQSYIQVILHKRVWLDMYHDVVRLAMVDLDRKIDSALMYNSREKKMW